MTLKLKTDVFPINYFKSIWTPLTTFKNRFELNWFNMIVVLIFLNALMIIPVTLNYTSMDSFPLSDFYPKTLQLIDQEAADELTRADYQNGEMLFADSFVLEQPDGVIAGGLTAAEQKEYETAENFIFFEKNQFIIGEEGVPTTTVLYTKDFSLGEMKSASEIVDELSRQWFNQNRVLIVLIFSLLVGMFLLVMTILLIFGSAFILYLTKKGNLTTITTYKEAVNLILNGLGVPTLAAMVFGLFHFDIYLMVTIQTLGLVLYLVIIFYKVQFNDKKVETIGL